MAEREPTTGERLAVSEAQARGGPDQPVQGIDARTDHLNLDSASDARRADELPRPVGYVEGAGNEGPFAPLGGDPAKSAGDAGPNEQGGTASGAPETGDIAVADMS